VILTALVLVNLAMSPQVGDDREMAAATIDFACKGYTELASKFVFNNFRGRLTLLSSVTVHVCL
jgi:hypothetical protein